MKRKLISSGSHFEKEIGYSRAVVDGNWVFLSVTTGYNYDNMTIADDIVSQTEQCMKNIVSALKQSDAKLESLISSLKRQILKHAGQYYAVILEISDQQPQCFQRDWRILK